MGRLRKRNNSCGSSYRQGCRCTECKREHADDALEYKAKRALNGGRPLLEGKPEVQHGDITMYGRGCKCELCMQAMRERSKFYNYGESIPDQPELCECCGLEPAIFIDHDHNTGVVRGWLCPRCNSGIGLLGDAISGLTLALNYLVNAGSIDATMNRARHHGTAARYGYGCRCEPCVEERRRISSLGYYAKKAAPPVSDSCDCCGRAGELQFDHCHDRGVFRGWICKACNMGLGRLGDGADGIQHAIDYLSRAQGATDHTI